MINIPVILLAAGGSKRMGSPKQLLPWGDKTLIEHQIQVLAQTGNAVNIVLGAHSGQIAPMIERLNVNVIMNNNWESGMGSSVASGVKYVAQNYPGAEGVLITLLDQPLVTPDYLQKMLEKFQTGKKQIIVSDSDAGWKGVPVIFDRRYFVELQTLEKDEGAKNIIHSHPQNVTSIKCGNITEDLDTPEAYHILLDKFLSEQNC